MQPRREVERVRGRQDQQVSILPFVDVESRIRLDHPLRTIKYVADTALAELSPLFDAMYAEIGRPSIPPEAVESLAVDQPLFGSQ
jgi:hypothetical protein